MVDNLIQMNLHRVQALREYESDRTYRVEYRGFWGDRTAEMAVKVKYSAPRSKVFTIESTSGSKLLIDRVLKKLLEAEKEASDEEVQRRSALNRDNYDFNLVGFEDTDAGPMYVLTVEPKTKDKFLYRGRIWVDAKDFAVTRIEAEPAKNPSFWTKKSEIEQAYRKVNDFWLPERNHSLSSIRLGGRADLTIEYKDYLITSAAQVEKLSQKESAPLAGFGVTQSSRRSPEGWCFPAAWPDQQHREWALVGKSRGNSNPIRPAGNNELRPHSFPAHGHSSNKRLPIAGYRFLS